MPSYTRLTSGPDSWRALLADPAKQWRVGYSARTLAYSWEDADGFPTEVAAAFGACSDPLLAGLEPVLLVPEFMVPLPGGQRASQNDAFVLGRSAAGPVTIMVEGKVRESFGPTVGEWLTDASRGKRTRLRALEKAIGLAARPESAVRYQLLHRAASAVITGEQYRAAAAVMLVHSFSQERAGFSDYAAFARLFGIDAREGVVQRLGSASAVPLFGVWVVGDPAYLER